MKPIDTGAIDQSWKLSSSNPQCVAHRGETKNDLYKERNIKNDLHEKENHVK